MIASGSRRAITAAASAIAAQESRGEGSTSTFSSGIEVSWRETAAACATPVTTRIRSDGESRSRRATVACNSDASVPVSGCRNFGWPARESGQRRVPVPPASTTP